jgi:hypothetical protein
MQSAMASGQSQASMSAGVGGMDELLPLVKQLTDPDQVRTLYRYLKANKRAMISFSQVN